MLTTEKEQDAPRQVPQIDAPPLTVRRYGRDTYLVRSQVAARNHWYLCEIPNLEHEHGQCSCKDHSIRITAPLNRGEVPERWLCKHQRITLATLDGCRQLLEMHGIEAAPETLIPWA